MLILIISGYYLDNLLLFIVSLEEIRDMLKFIINGLPNRTVSHYANINH
jgi:hypothetical protein